MNKKLIESLAKLAKVQDVEEFTKALESETGTSFDLGLDNLVVRTTEEDSEIRTNLLDEAKKKNFTDAFEIQIKNMKKDLGLEFEGKKSDDFVDAFRNKILEDAKVEPSKKIEELNSSLEALREQLSEKDSSFSELQKSIETEKRSFKAQSLIPNLPENLGLTKDEAVSLYFMAHEIKEDGVYRNGEKLKDNLEKALSFEDSITSFVESKGWNKTTPTGRGGGAQSGGGSSTQLPTNEQEYQEYIANKGWNVGSQEANAVLSQMAEANTE